MEKLISKKFFGTGSDDYFRRVLVTNIEQIYEGIVKNVVLVKRDCGLYQSSVIKLKNKTWRIIKITPGNVIVDVLKLLKNKSEEIVLIGLAGCLDGNFRIGEIVCPAKAVRSDNLKKNISFRNSGKEKPFGVICQTAGLIQSREFYKKLIKNGVNFVDMESYFLARFSLENNKKSKVISIVSDFPISKPFYKINDRQFEIDYNLIIRKI